MNFKNPFRMLPRPRQLGQMVSSAQATVQAMAETLVTVPHPAASYAEAVARIEALQAKDLAEVNPVCRSIFLSHGQKVARSIVLMHGLTNCPRQAEKLAQLCHTQGYNVLVPRTPHHGLSNRLTEALADLTAADLVALVTEAVDIAHGLGEQVTLVGFSMSGVQAAWAAQHRTDLARAVIISPSLAVKAFPPALISAMALMARRAPNRFLWWDPRYKDSMAGPPHAYPRFSTHSLAETLLLGQATLMRARQQKPGAHSIVMVTNTMDDALDNSVAKQLADLWQRQGASVERYEFRSAFRLAHDLLDPYQPNQRTEIVYPILMALIQASDPHLVRMDI